MKIEGEAVLVNKFGKRRTVEGEKTLPDDTALQKLFVEGSVYFGDITCDKFKVEGECFGNSLIAEQIEIEGSINVDVVKASKILDIEGEMNINSAESATILIESRFGRINEVKCNDLKIFDVDDEFEAEISSSKFKLKISNKKKFSQILIDSIVADNIELENCKVETVKCNNAIIGSNCTINKLIITENLDIVENSKVNSIIRE